MPVAVLTAENVARRRLARLIARDPRPPEGSSPSGKLKSAPASVLRVAGHALLASAKYRPGFYPGELTLFVPRGRDPGLPSPQAIWRRHARALSVVDTEGAHATMLAAPHADTIAAALTRRLPQL